MTNPGKWLKGPTACATSLVCGDCGAPESEWRFKDRCGCDGFRVIGEVEVGDGKELEKLIRSIEGHENDLEIHT